VQIKPGINKEGDIWTIRVQIKFNGRSYDKKKKIEGITLQKALALQAQMRIELESSIKDDPVEKDTFSEYWNEWLLHLEAVGKARASTIRIRKVIGAQLILPFFKDRNVSSITRKDISAWQVWLSRLKQEDGTEYSKEYLRTAWRDLKAAFSDARNLLNLEKNPTDGFDFSVRGKEPVQKDALTLEETKALLQTALAESQDICAMIWLAVTTGMRFGEVTALTWQDIDMEKNIIRVTKSQVEGHVGSTKTSRNRIAPLHPDVKQLLLRWKEQQKAVSNINNVVFPSNTGGYRYPSVLIKPLRNCCNRAGITKHITAHSLRRTCNNLVRISLGDVAARKMLGHVSESQTARYSVVEAGELQDGQRQAFGRLAEPAPGQESEAIVRHLKR
jgi:integrase